MNEREGVYVTTTGAELLDTVEAHYELFISTVYPMCEHDIIRRLDTCTDCDKWEKGMERGKEIAKGEYE